MFDLRRTEQDLTEDKQETRERTAHCKNFSTAYVKTQKAQIDAVTERTWCYTRRIYKYSDLTSTEEKRAGITGMSRAYIESIMKHPPSGQIRNFQGLDRLSSYGGSGVKSDPRISKAKGSIVEKPK